ncbi:TIGR03905 family TSCPD domain-containing protein [Anaerolinea thermolimosa]|uniref:TIGR03905 family TSCPD domain-containing protein n=1 Tax=Anaerolinea thermolimosa TaxID=229919 RepID=UPI001EEED25C|nr:TIGR03905 family TSCPD domain-containing protein [Anaerolinea thermolimosa]
MKEIHFTPTRTCSRQIHILLEGTTIRQVEFEGGCDGNLQAICRLLVGLDATEAIQRLRGIDCGNRGTSCPDQLARALQSSL